MSFSYHNGIEQVETDADILRQRLDKLGEGIFRELEADATSPKAREQLRLIFEVPTFEEGGLSDDELMDLFDGYLTLISRKERENEQAVRSADESPE